MADETREIVEEHSGWLVPLAVFLVTACLSALVLIYYFAPVASTLGPELPSPTDSPIRVSLSIGTAKFRIPANYLPMASTRRGGAKEEIDLAGVLPDLDGFSLGVVDDFTANAPDSPFVHLTLRSGPPPLPERDRLRRIYLPQVEDEYGLDESYGLRHYNFRADTGYHSQDLFFIADETEQASLICDKPDANTPSPNCIRNYTTGDGLTLSYRFKRAHLKQWREIDKNVRALIAGFEDNG